MSSTTQILNNINFMSENRYNSLSQIKEDELYAVKVNPTNNTLFDVKWTDYEINDPSWVRSDNFSWLDGNTYSEAYNHLVDDWEDYWKDKDVDVASDWYTETIGSYTIAFIIANDGHRILFTDQETIAQNIYNESGISWFYILDKTNHRFKLPRNGHGEIVEKYGPSNNGKWYRVYSDGWIEQGGVKVSWSAANTYENVNLWKSYSNSYYEVIASLIGSATTIYTFKLGNRDINTTTAFKALINNTSGTIRWEARGYGTAVQNTQKKYFYMYLGRFSKSALEQTAGLNSTLFNDKVDLDGNNATFSHVIETYRSGQEWYRLYSDGWCEQGGETPDFSGKDSTVTVNLLKPYSNTAYCVELTTFNSGYSPCVYISTRSTNSFNARRESSSTSVRTESACWYACGQT